MNVKYDLSGCPKMLNSPPTQTRKGCGNDVDGIQMFILESASLSVQMPVGEFMSVTSASLMAYGLSSDPQLLPEPCSS